MASDLGGGGGVGSAWGGGMASLDCQMRWGLWLGTAPLEGGQGSRRLGFGSRIASVVR